MINNFQKLRADSELKGRIDDITDDVLFKYSKPKQDKEPIIENNENKNTNPDNNNWRDTVVKDIKMQMRLKGLINKINPLLKSKIIEEPKARWENNEKGITQWFINKYGGIAIRKPENVSNINCIKGGLNVDISLNNKGLEIKEPTDANLRTIMDHIKKARDQTNNNGFIIVDMTGNTKVTINELLKELNYRIKYHHVYSEVIIKKDNKTVAWLKAKK